MIGTTDVIIGAIRAPTPDREASRSKSQSECLRGEIRSLDPVRVFGPDHPFGREASIPRSGGAREACRERALSSRTCDSFSALVP